MDGLFHVVVVSVHDVQYVFLISSVIRSGGLFCDYVLDVVTQLVIRGGGYSYKDGLAFETITYFVVVVCGKKKA